MANRKFPIAMVSGGLKVNLNRQKINTTTIKQMITRTLKRVEKP